MTKAEIVTEVALRTGRASGDVTDIAIEAAILYITLNVEALRRELTTTTIPGRPYYDLRSVPGAYRGFIIAKIDDGLPLNRIPSWDEYQALIAEETETNRDEPSRFIPYDDYLYLYPTPKDAQTLTLFCSIMEMDADSISLPDEWKECMFELVSYQVYKNKGMATSEAASAHRAEAENWIRLLGKNGNDKESFGSIQYNDM